MKGMETMIASMLGINPVELKQQAEKLVAYMVQQTQQINARVERIEAAVSRIEKMLCEVEEAPVYIDTDSVLLQPQENGHGGNA